MSCRVYAQGVYRSGQPFMHCFPTKRAARAWAAKYACVLRRIWAVYSNDALPYRSLGNLDKSPQPAGAVARRSQP